MERVLSNAERLNSDAELLLKNNRYPSSRFLALIAKEEIGKAFLLADLWAAKEDLSPKEYKGIFRAGAAHANKLAAAGRAFLKTEAWQNMGDLFAEFDQESKERSLYVDYHESGNFGYWTGPVDDPELDNAMRRTGVDLDGMKNRFHRMDELDISRQIEHNFSAVGSMRNFLKTQRRVQPGMEPPTQPIIVAPIRVPPRIQVDNEFTVEYLLRSYEYCQKTLGRSDITRIPSSLPKTAPSLSWPVPTLEKLRADVERIPSEDGKRAYALYHLGLLRTNLFSEIHDKSQYLGHNEDYDSAIALMNEYAIKVAIPFNKKESYLGRAVRATKNVRPGKFGPEVDYARQWKSRHNHWLKKSSRLDSRTKFRAYLDLNYTFSMLHAMSFSSSNFPRLDELTEDELNRFLVSGHFP